MLTGLRYRSARGTPATIRCSRGSRRRHRSASSRTPQSIPISICSPPTDRRPFFFNMLKPAALFRAGQFVEHRSGERQPARHPDAHRSLRHCRRAGRRHHRLAAGAGRTSGRAAGTVRAGPGLLRDHWTGVHADSDPVPAALLGVSRPPHVHVLDHLVPHDSRRRPRQPLFRTHRRRPTPAVSNSCQSRSRRSCWSKPCCCRRPSSPPSAGDWPAARSSLRLLSSRSHSRSAIAFRSGCASLAGAHRELTAWMWGVNGACGVMASIVAVMVSMWLGIEVNLLIAAGLYLLLALSDAGACASPEVGNTPVRTRPT